MKNRKRNFLITALLSTVLAVVGYFHLHNAVNWGSESAGNYVRTKMGGSMNTTEYQIILEHFIKSNKWIGIILLSVGLLFLFRNIEMINFNKKQMENESDS